MLSYIGFRFWAFVLQTPYRGKNTGALPRTSLVTFVPQTPFLDPQLEILNTPQTDRQTDWPGPKSIT